MEGFESVRSALAEFLGSSAYFGTVLTVAAYSAGAWLRSRLRLGWLNPMLTAILVSVGVVALLGLDLEKYAEGTRVITYLLTPATVCLAIPLYEQFQKLRDNWPAVILGVASGTLASLALVLGGAAAFSLSRAEYASMLPKSITTAIGIALSEQYGGIVGITVGAICLTGILGNVLCVQVLRLFRVTEPVARGVAIGTASHALGTSRALQLGEVEGAMSGLSLAVAGLLTVVLAGFFMKAPL